MVLDHVDANLPKTNLDIGCGTGQLTRELSHRGYKCLGIDVSSSAVKLATANAGNSDLSYTHFDFENDDLSKLLGQPYSLITCKLVYAFIKDKAEMLKRVASLLAENGSFVVITPLKTDVQPEKAGIAVDLDQTMAELKSVFKSVESEKGQGVTYFFCRN